MSRSHAQTLREENPVFLERDLLVACWSNSKSSAPLAAVDLGDFQDFAAKAGLEAVRAIMGRGAEVSMPVMRQQLLNQGDLEAFNVLVAHMADGDADTYGPSMVRSLIQQIQHEACIRRARKVLLDLGKMLDKSSKQTSQEIQSEISSKLAEAFSVSAQGHAIFLREAFVSLADKMVDREAALRDGEPVVQKLSTGLTALDKASKGGAGRGQMIILAGRPGTGKSSLARQLSIEWAKHGAVYYWSGEMSVMEIAEAMAAHQLGQGLEKIRAVPVYQLAENPNCPQIIIDDKSVRNTGHLVSRIQFCSFKTKLSAIVVDYFGLCCRAKDPTDIGLELKEIMRLGKDLDVPTLVLVQMNRDEKNRQDKRPVLTDLRSSGDIEQDAHIVWMLYKPCLHDKDEPEDYIQVWQRKHRTGPQDVCAELSWEGELTKFGAWLTADEKFRFQDPKGGPAMQELPFDEATREAARAAF